MTPRRVANMPGFRVLLRNCDRGKLFLFCDRWTRVLNIQNTVRQYATVPSQSWRSEDQIMGILRPIPLPSEVHLSVVLYGALTKSIMNSSGCSGKQKFVLSRQRRSYLTAVVFRSYFAAASKRINNNVEQDPIESDPIHVGTETAMLSLEGYLRDVRGVSEEDSRFIARNCPLFVTRLAKFVTTSRLTENFGAAIRPQLYTKMFFEKEERDAFGELVPFFESMGMISSTLADTKQISKYSLSLAGEQGLIRSTRVLESLGYPRKRLWEILEHNMELLTWTAEELQAKIEFLDKLGVKRKDMVLLVKDSSVFTADVEERLGPLLQYLDEISVEKHVIGDLMKFNPQGLIKMPVANFRERVDFLLKLGLSSSEVEKSMRLFPQLVHLRLANLSEKIEYFGGIGVERENMVKIVAKLPSIFRHSIAKNLVPKVEMLVSLGVSRNSVAKIVARYPQFFGCSIDNLKRKLAFFEANGLTGSRLVKLLTWHPRAFSFSVDENLSKKLKFLITKGFEVRSSSMVRALGSCLSISTDSLEARFLNLQSFGFTPKEVCELVKKQPTILCLSEKTIRAKMNYLINTMNRPAIEIMKCPGYLLYSLELRIKPRHKVIELLTSKGYLRDEAYSLSTILQPRENVFKDRFIRLDPECAVLFTVHLVKPVDPEQSESLQFI